MNCQTSLNWYHVRHETRRIDSCHLRGALGSVGRARDVSSRKRYRCPEIGNEAVAWWILGDTRGGAANANFRPGFVPALRGLHERSAMGELPQSFIAESTSNHAAELWLARLVTEWRAR